MKLLVTGVDGFIGKNLRVGIAERGWECLPITRASSEVDLRAAIPGLVPLPSLRPNQR